MKLGPYEIIGEVGRGGMGVVYRGLDPIIQRPVALKVIRLQDFFDSEEREVQRERLFREARTAGILSHPGIVTIYQVGEDSGVAYIAMEFVDGASLSQMLAAEPRPKTKHVLAVIRQVATALDYAHTKGVVHRDIKPGNIMVQRGGMVKITDFGIAKLNSAARTRTGLRVGTPFYMSPEQIQGIAIDGRTDQYSLAVVSYQMLTGERPFSADTLPTLMYKIMNEEPQVLRTVSDKLGENVALALCRGLSKKAEGRYRTCGELVSALEVACGGHAAGHS
jgi:serine/threonine-protein kinase